MKHMKHMKHMKYMKYMKHMKHMNIMDVLFMYVLIHVCLDFQWVSRTEDTNIYSEGELSMMDNSELQVHFSDPSALLAAKATLEELGYKPYQSAPLELYIPTDRQDPQSAVEIVQSHGGSAVFASSVDELDQFQSVSIPAHLVNEDWDESYVRGNSQTLNSSQSGEHGEGEGEGERNYSDDPVYDDSADGFSGSVKA